jgi:NACalpha-BTF3-like transcription factor
MQAAEQFKPQPETSLTAEAKDVAPVDEDSDEDDVDESGVEAKDIELVMAQVCAPYLRTTLPHSRHSIVFSVWFKTPC